MGWRPAKPVFLAAVAAVGAACTLLTDLSGLSGDNDSTPLPDRVVSDDTGRGPSDADDTANDASGIAPDAGPYHPAYERAATVTNLATVDLAASSTQCFVVPNIDSPTKTRADLGDFRIFGPNTERERVVDVRGATSTLLSFCFSLERAIPPGKSETYVIKYGDPNAAVPPPAEADLFRFWEGFEGTTISAQRWLVNGNISIANGLLTLPKGQNAITTHAGQDDIPALASLEIRAKIVDPQSKGTSPNDTSTDIFYWWLGFQHKGDFSPTEPWSIFIGRAPGSFRAEHKAVSGTKCFPAECKSVEKAQRPDFRVYRIDRRTTQTELIDDDGNSLVAEGSNGDESVMIRNWLLSSDLVVDWARARPFVDPPPKLDLGPEEPAP